VIEFSVVREASTERSRNVIAMHNRLKIEKSIEYYFQVLCDQISVIAWLLSSAHRSGGMLKHNYRRYGSPYVVEFFRRYNRTGLQEAEQLVLGELATKLPGMNMLDVGVGAGRTTHHFAHLTRCYVGTDYSRRMLGVANVSSQRFIQNSFVVCDARALPLREAFFDFILFSYNGIDYMAHEDRLKALTEITRVGRRGCIFLFSAHNLYSIDSLFTAKPTLDPLKLLNQIGRTIILRVLYDVRELKKCKHVTICDDPRLGLLVYYVAPEEQIRQLLDSGFKDVEVVTLSDDRISNSAELASLRDRWLNYLCHT